MMSTIGTMGSDARHWAGHKLVAGVLRAVIVAVPLVLSIAAGFVVGWSINGTATVDVIGRVLAAGLASVATFVVAEWLARRLLPLVILLRLSLVFPDRAPSRFSVALRSTSVRRLRDWARAHHDEIGEQALAEKVLTLASALNFHDRRTRGHSERTRALAELVIEELGLSTDEANEVRWGAFLHDIGKLLVPSAILNKPGAPSTTEWVELRQHPAEGGRIVSALRPFIGTGVDAVLSHHESFDGSGYPAGLRGEEIPLSARIVAVVDSFEVMTAVRSYKRPMSTAAARRELVSEAGKQFDPKVVRAFVNVSLGRVHWALGAAAWLAELPFVGLVPRAAAQVGTVVGAGSSTVSTAALASVATASLGATLMANPLAGPVPAAASATPSPAAVTAVAGAGLGAGSSGAHLSILGEVQQTAAATNGTTGTGPPGNGPTGTGPAGVGPTGTGPPANGPTGTGPPAKGLSATTPPGNGTTGTGPPAKGLSATTPPGNGPTGTGPPANGPTGTGPPAKAPATTLGRTGTPGPSSTPGGGSGGGGAAGLSPVLGAVGQAVATTVGTLSKHQSAAVATGPSSGPSSGSSNAHGKSGSASGHAKSTSSG